MRTSFYLTVGKNGSVRVNKSRPDIKFDEITIEMALNLPDVLFKKPVLQGSIEIKDDQVRANLITVDMKNNIADAIKQSTGAEVRLEILEPKE